MRIPKVIIKIEFLKILVTTNWNLKWLFIWHLYSVEPL